MMPLRSPKGVFPSRRSPWAAHNLPIKNIDLDRSDLCRSRSSGMQFVLPETQRRIRGATTAPWDSIEISAAAIASDSVGAAAGECKIILQVFLEGVRGRTLFFLKRALPPRSHIVSLPVFLSAPTIAKPSAKQITASPTATEPTSFRSRGRENAPPGALL